MFLICDCQCPCSVPYVTEPVRSRYGAVYGYVSPFAYRPPRPPYVTRSIMTQCNVYVTQEGRGCELNWKVANVKAETCTLVSAYRYRVRVHIRHVSNADRGRGSAGGTCCSGQSRDVSSKLCSVSLKRTAGYPNPGLRRTNRRCVTAC